MNYQTQQVFNTAAIETDSFDNRQNQPTLPIQMADSPFANMQPNAYIPTQLPPSGIPMSHSYFPGYENMQPSPNHFPQVAAPPVQPTYNPGMMSIYPTMDFNQTPLSAQAVTPMFMQHTQQFASLGLYSGVTPMQHATPMQHTPTQPTVFLFPAPAAMPQFVEVPANMQVLETVHGQVFPILKGEESVVSNASSESGLASDTPPPQNIERLPPKKPSPIKRAPPGFNSKFRAQVAPAQRRSETVNYARAAKSRLPTTFKRNVRPASSGKVEKISRQPRAKREPALRSPRKSFNSNQRRPKKKFGFRSKQNKIDEVYEALSRKYENLGILASTDEVLRGEDTLRLHVKKFKALKRIQEALDAVEREPSIRISKVSIPLSMKNQFQKKGFLVYTQVEDVSMIPQAKRIFQQFDEFKKCEVARQTSDNNSMRAPVTIVEEASIVEKAAPKKEEPMEKEEEIGEAGEEGWEDTIVSYGEPNFTIDEFCGSLKDCGVSFGAPPETGSPEASPQFGANKLFDEGECGLGDLDLRVLPMLHKISIGEGA